MTRGLARVARADAARLLASGDADGAAKRVAAILRLAVHVSQGARSGIELLTAAAIAQLGAGFVAENSALAGAPWRTDIRQAIAGVRAGATLNSAAVLRADGEMMVRSLRDGTFVENLRALGGRDWGSASQADREAAAAKLEAINGAANAAWGAPDAVARLEALSARAKQEGIGDLYTSRDKTRAAIDRLNADLAAADAALSR